MAVKYPEDYLDELEGFFPQIERKELSRMINDMSLMMGKHLRIGHKGITVSSKDSLVGNDRRYHFAIQRIFGKKHYNSIRKAIRERNKKRDELYGKEQ